MSLASGASSYDEDKAMEAAMNVSVMPYQFMSASLNNGKDALATVLAADEDRFANKSNSHNIA